jgi:hypothetical protein
MKYKPFDQRLHDACDPIARSKVKHWLETVHQLQVIPNPNRFMVDLVCFKDLIPHSYVEVEMRLWRKDLHYCPYQTIHVPYRKQKLFHNDLPTYMCVVNQYLQWAYWIDAQQIMDSDVIEVSNSAVYADEHFYDVPITKWRLFELDELF